MPEPEPLPTTHWSLVLAAGQRSALQARQALEVLCQLYWTPLYAYLRRRLADPVEAQDVTQAFFAELLDKDYLRTATPERGRFRAFLLTTCQHFLSKHWAKAKAQKRGGGRQPLSLDFAATEKRLEHLASTDRTPEQEYERQWALALLARVLEQLERTYAEAGKTGLFLALKPLLLGEHGGLTYAMVAQQLGLSEEAVKMARRPRPGRLLRSRWARGCLHHLIFLQRLLEHLAVQEDQGPPRLGDLLRRQALVLGQVSKELIDGRLAQLTGMAQPMKLDVAEAPKDVSGHHRGGGPAGPDRFAQAVQQLGGLGRSIPGGRAGGCPGRRGGRRAVHGGLLITVQIFPNDTSVVCSPKTGPGGMRVSEAPRGQETNHEATHA